MDVLTCMCVIILLSESLAFECKVFEDLGKDNVFTTKYHMAGEDFRRNFLWGDKLLRITGDYEDWPLYNYWVNNESILEKIYVNATHILDTGKVVHSNISLSDWSKSESKMSFEHILEKEDTELSESLLIPLAILSCRDLYKDFMTTSVYGLLGTSYEIDEYVEFYDDTFIMFFAGGARFTFKNNPENSLTFSAGELIYIPRGTCAQVVNVGRQLAVRITWEQTRGNGNSDMVTCNARSLFNAHMQPTSSRSFVSFAPSTPLKNGQDLPPVGMGTSRLYGKMYNTLRRALHLGYRLIETSQEYFGDEKKQISAEIEIGRAIRDSNIPRKEIIVTTRIALSKLTNSVEELMKRSLLDLQFDYLDVVIVELPFIELGEEVSLSDEFWRVWTELEVLRRKGVINNLGVCNVKDATDLRTILARADDSLSVVQNWFDPLRTNDEIRTICKENNVAFMGYSTLGYKRMEEIKDEIRPANPILTMESIAKNSIVLDMPPSSYVLRWSMNQGVTVTPCTSDEYHVETNLYSQQLNVPDIFMDILTVNSFRSAQVPDDEENTSVDNPEPISRETRDEL